MRTEFTLTEAEYAEAVLAAGLAPRVAPPGARRWPRRVLFVVATCLFAPALGFLSWISAAEWRDAIRSAGWASVFRVVLRYEWLLPYALYSALTVTAAIVATRGVRALRAATLALGGLTLATASLVVAAAFFGRGGGPLDDFGMLRLVPWLAPATTLYALTRGWVGVARRSFRTSPYSRGTVAVALDDASVSVELPTVTSTWRWPAFTSVRRTRHLVLLMIAPRQIGVILPERAIGDAAAVDAFADAAASRLSSARRAFAVELRPAE